MAYARKTDGVWIELSGSFVHDDIQYPANWLDLATPAERKALRAVEIVEADDPPTDARVTGTDIIGDAVPHRIWLTEPLPIGELREQRWSEAKAIREARANGGCATPLGHVDTDPDSQRKINGAVTGALIAQMTGTPYAIDWTMSDNGVVTHDGAAMIALGVAVLHHIDACQAAGSAIRKVIDAAPDAAGVAAIDIDAGYPG